MKAKCLLFLLIVVLLPIHGENVTFYTLNTRNGLSDNRVLQLMQLKDGRILAYTDRMLNIYDGRKISFIDKAATRWVPLDDYKGYAHLYADNYNRIWVKEHQRLTCFSLSKGRAIEFEKDSLVKDFFVDSENKHIWLVKEEEVYCKETSRSVSIPQHWGTLLDLDVMADTLFFFYHSGIVSAHDLSNDGRLLYTTELYPPADSIKFGNTSLVVRDIDGTFLQTRMGNKCSGFFKFNPQTGECRLLLETQEPLHTLAVTPSRVAHLTTREGYLTYNLLTEEVRHIKTLRLPDGTELTTGINTVCPDKEGGIWLGTYNRGVLYTSPFAGLFETQQLNIKLHPILSDIYLHGEPLLVGMWYDKQMLLPQTSPYTTRLDFSHSQNNIAFLFTTMNYVNPRQTRYRYRLIGSSDEQWHIATADSQLPMVNDDGAFYFALTALQPGNYALEVMAYVNPGEWGGSEIRRVDFQIRQPWWTTPRAYIIYILLLAVFVLLVVGLNSRRLRRKLEQQAREEQLMMRIQELIAQSRLNRQDINLVLSEPQATGEEDRAQQWREYELEFMNRATQFVEANLGNANYSVEMLAKDLCIERTGLYKKLTALMQKSPVVFIRNIRLQRAAALLNEGKLSITEIAEQTGFNSVSYFSKCFQQQYGYRPSEYKKNSFFLS